MTTARRACDDHMTTTRNGHDGSDERISVVGLSCVYRTAVTVAPTSRSPYPSVIRSSSKVETSSYCWCVASVYLSYSRRVFVVRLRSKEASSKIKNLRIIGVSRASIYRISVVYRSYIRYLSIINSNERFFGLIIMKDSVELLSFLLR